MKDIFNRKREDEDSGEYRSFCKEIPGYSRVEQKRKIKAIEKDRKNEIKLKMPGLLRSGHIVYCRNPSLSLSERRCSTLECVYKDNRENVVQGCTNCMKFHVSRREDFLPPL